MKRSSPERHLQLQIIHYLKARGYAVGKIKSFGIKNRFDPYMWRGLPDLLVFTPKLHFIEIKWGKNIQTSEQKDFQKFCNLADIPYILTYDLETVMQIIK